MNLKTRLLSVSNWDYLKVNLTNGSRDYLLKVPLAEMLMKKILTKLYKDLKIGTSDFKQRKKLWRNKAKIVRNLS